MDILKEFLKGEATFPEVYGTSIVVGVVYLILGFILAIALPKSAIGYFYTIYQIGRYLLIAFFLVAIWQTARHYAGPRHWAYLAFAIVVLNVLGVIVIANKCRIDFDCWVDI